MSLCDISHFYSTDILTSQSGICRSRRPPFGVYPSYNPAGHCNASISQAVKDARASQDTVIDIFERIEMFFRRLEIYTEVPPTSEMMDIVIRILAEVISILGIAMKEIKQGRMSKCSLIQVRHC